MQRQASARPSGWGRPHRGRRNKAGDRKRQAEREQPEHVGDQPERQSGAQTHHQHGCHSNRLGVGSRRATYRCKLNQRLTDAETSGFASDLDCLRRAFGANQMSWSRVIVVNFGSVGRWTARTAGPAFSASDKRPRQLPIKRRGRLLRTSQMDSRTTQRSGDVQPLSVVRAKLLIPRRGSSAGFPLRRYPRIVAETLRRFAQGRACRRSRAPDGNTGAQTKKTRNSISKRAYLRG